MGDATGNSASRLAELRAQIDAIDESVHRLLMQRASVIDELIAVKGTARNGAAFRPGREADMMRRLAARHGGHLPLTAVEHLWREIISTFTSLQAPFDVAVSIGADVRAAIESARFTFGFTVPLLTLPSAASVVERLEEGGDRLGLVLLAERSGPWWDALRNAQVVARLPFIEAEKREAGAPALVLSPPLADPVPFEVECFAVRGADEARIADAGFAVLARDGSSALLAAPRGSGVIGRLGAGGDALDIRSVGGYAAPLRPGS